MTACVKDCELTGAYHSHQHKGHIHCRHYSPPPRQSVTQSQLNHWQQWHEGHPAFQKALKLQKGASQSSHSAAIFQWDEARGGDCECTDLKRTLSEAMYCDNSSVNTLYSSLSSADPQWARHLKIRHLKGTITLLIPHPRTHPPERKIPSQSKWH